MKKQLDIKKLLVLNLPYILMDSRICLYTETRQKWRVSSILQRSWYL